MSGVVLDCNVPNGFETVNPMRNLAEDVSNNDCLATLSSELPSFADALAFGILGQSGQVRDDFQTVRSAKVDMCFLLLAELGNSSLPKVVADESRLN